MEQISSLLAAAAVGGFTITAVAGKFMIPALHRLHFGQTIREEGPTWHNKKNGTPTMGGLWVYLLASCSPLGVVYGSVPQLCAGGAGPPADWLPACWYCFWPSATGLIGFLDDFIKVIKHRNLGLTACAEDRFAGRCSPSGL